MYLSELGDASVGLAGSGDKPARMLADNRFETELILQPGNNSVAIAATDTSGNRLNYRFNVTLPTANVSPLSFTYDLNGNLTSDGMRSYEWDTHSRLKKVTWGAGQTTEFKYNALGQRCESTDTVGGVATSHFYLFDGIRLVDRRTGTAANTATIDCRYFSQGEQRKNGSSWENYFYSRDHLGSIREVVKSVGGANTLVARYDYDPYGKRLTQYQASAYTGGCDFGYTGHVTAPSLVSGQTELVLTHYRAYDPNLGRWLSSDPIGEAGGMNLYGYVGGNPLNFRDPLGLASWHDHYEALTKEWNWSEAAESLALGAMATADGFIPFSDPFKDSGGYSGCEAGAGFSKGAGQVAFGATALAAGTGIWSRVGLPTMSVGGTIGTGGGFHAFYGVTAQGTTAWMHGVLSAQTGLMVVSEASAGIGTFSTYWNTLSGIPIIFPAAAAAIGMKSSNCVTAAGSALGRGWFGN